MEWVETTGRTVAEALEAALDELGVDEQDAEVVVVAEPRPGILGIGRSDARVRARVRPSAPRPKRPQRGRHREQRRSGRGRDGGGRGAAAVTGVGTTTTAAAAGERTSGGGPAAEAGQDGAVAMPRRRRGGGQRRAVAAKVPAGDNRRGGEDGMGVDQQAEAVGAFVQGVVQRFGYEAVDTSVRVEDDHIYVDVTGEGLGLLIGQRGRTLDALQELARTVAQRRGDEPAARVTVDVAGFRAKRIAALQTFVTRIAEQVLATGEPAELEPMSPADRKIVHDTVNSIDGVESTSEGDEPERFVVLRPTGTASGAETTADVG